MSFEAPRRLVQSLELFAAYRALAQERGTLAVTCRGVSWDAGWGSGVLTDANIPLELPYEVEKPKTTTRRRLALEDDPGPPPPPPLEDVIADGIAREEEEEEDDDEAIAV